MKFTIGMSTWDDFDGVYFTIQDLYLHHDMEDVEVVVIDNFGCDFTRDFVEGWNRGKYVHFSGIIGTSAPRDLVFHQATGDVVMCVDCHVLFLPGVIARWKQYFRDNPNSKDLLQGPMMNDDLTSLNTHFNPIWNSHMYGTWGVDPRGLDQDAEPFDIPMQGLGMFSCRKDAWLGFNAKFSGFGGEEGYIHEKFRQAGHRTLCAPWFRWLHRFGRPYSVSYPLQVNDRIRNYLIGHSELNLDLRPIIDHFSDYISKDHLSKIARESLSEGTYNKYFKK